LPVIEALSQELIDTDRRDVQISIDTMNATTALAAISAGAKYVNDVSGGLADPKMLSLVAATGATFIISHWRGFSTEMDQLNQYLDVAKEVGIELSSRIKAAQAAGVSKNKIIIDPGLGFAKDMQQNWKLVARIEELEKLGFPILVGASRKRFIAGVLDAEEPASVSNERRDLGTAVLTALLLQHNIWGFRVHNVIATADAISIVEALRVAEGETKGQS
jgi:dihydropteroate synthase